MQESTNHKMCDNQKNANHKEKNTKNYPGSPNLGYSSMSALSQLWNGIRHAILPLQYFLLSCHLLINIPSYPSTYSPGTIIKHYNDKTHCLLAPNSQTYKVSTFNSHSTFNLPILPHSLL